MATYRIEITQDNGKKIAYQYLSTDENLGEDMILSVQCIIAARLGTSLPVEGEADMVNAFLESIDGVKP